MAIENKRIPTQMLHSLFLLALGDSVTYHSQIEKKPLEIDTTKPYPLRLRIYMFNCTNPSGGRPRDEYKSQLIVPNQERGERGSFDNSDGRIILLVAYARVFSTPHDGVFIFYDALKHNDFSYSTNLQVKAAIINQALFEHLSIGKKKNGEIIISARGKYIHEAIDKRISIK